MKKLLLSLILPSVFFGLDLHLFGLQDTLNLQNQNSLQFTQMLFDRHQDEEQFGLNASFFDSKQNAYSSQRGSFSLFSKFEDDDALIPYLNYTYSSLTSDSNKLSSNNISVGIKSMLDTDLFSLFSGIGVGGSFNQIQSQNLDYSYLFADAQLGLGKKIDFLDDRFLITPLVYLQYDYIYQEAVKNFFQTQHIHSLAILAGSQFDLGLFKDDDFFVSFSLFGFYKHLFLGEKLADLSSKRLRNQNSGYAGGGINLEFHSLLFALTVGSEFTKATYDLQALARIGVEF